MASTPLPLSGLVKGQQFSCTTGQDAHLRGHIIAHDDSFKAVAFRTDQSDVHIVNLDHVSNVAYDKPPQSAGSSEAALSQIDIDKVKRRYKEQVQLRMKEISKIGENVTPTAQRLFTYISKLYADTRWEDKDIVVLNDVRITPPYTAQQCSGSTNSEERLKLIVQKFHEQDQKS